MNFNEDIILEVESVITMDDAYRVLSPGYVWIGDGKFKIITDDPKDLQHVSAPRLKHATKTLMPGFFNTHTHTAMSLLRGVADDLPLKQWLFDRIFPLERKFGDENFVYFGSLVSAIEMIRGGTIAFNDMYYFEAAAARAAHEVGIRATCGQTLVDISGIEDAGNMLETFDKFLDAIKSYSRVRAAIAPHSIYGLSLELWEKLIEYGKSKDIMIHTHLSETEEEMTESQKKFGKTPTQVFESLGLWKCKSMAAHATCITDSDVEILGKNKVGIAYNPQSNLKLGTRICPVVDLRQKGASVGFGTDGAASNNNLDLFTEADFGAKLQTLRYGVGKLTAKDAMTMLTREGADAMGFQGFGRIELGKPAYFILLEGKSFHLRPHYNSYSRWVYSAGGADVSDVMIDGKWIMKDKKLTTIDEEIVFKELDVWQNKIKQSF